MLIEVPYIHVGQGGNLGVNLYALVWIPSFAGMTIVFFFSAHILFIMITIHYFASIREQLHKDSESLEWRDEFFDIASIKNYLSQHNESWKNLYQNTTILSAINQTMAGDNSPIEDGDEIAFFPPVTGG